MTPASRLRNPTPERLAEIRANRTRHLLRLKNIWANALRRAPTPQSRPKYNPTLEEFKHAHQPLP